VVGSFTDIGTLHTEGNESLTVTHDPLTHLDSDPSLTMHDP